MGRKNRNHRNSNYMNPQGVSSNNGQCETPNDVLIKNSKNMTGYIVTYSVVGGILFLMLFCPLYFYEHFMNSDVLLFVLLFLPTSLFFINLALLYYLRVKDWAKASSAGLVLHIHNGFFFFNKIEVFVPWTEISQFASYEVATKDGSVHYLLLRLKWSERIYKYNIDHLRGVIVAVSNFMQQPVCEELRQEVVSDEEENFVDYLLCAVFFLSLCSILYSMSLFDHTLIQYWFYLPFFFVVSAGALVGYKFVRKKEMRFILGVFSLSCFSVMAFLYVNYHFAEWDAKDEIQTHKVISTVHTSSKSGDITGYGLQIETNIGKKKLEYSLDQEFDLLSATEVDLYLHRGFWGFPVFKKSVPKNVVEVE